MKILALDTSTDYLSLAVTNGKRVLSRLHRKARRSHSRLLVPMIDKLLEKARIKLKDIDGFCIGIGPGSFTGLRIGVATIKGLAYSLERPIVAVPTLDAIAHNAKGFRGIICPILDARKAKVYACLYKSDGRNIRRISKYLLLPIAELIGKVKNIKERVLFLGDSVEQILRVTRGPARERGASRATERQDPQNFGKYWHPKAEVIARLGLDNFRKKRFVTPEDLEPLYLYSRECDITGR